MVRDGYPPPLEQIPTFADFFFVFLFQNENGFWQLGRYQWCIFFLCSFGYFLDLCWAQAFGLISGQIQQELGIADARIGDIFTAFSAGLTVGAFAWGLLVDIIGRKWCFNITCLIASVFGLIFAAPSNFGALCFICALIGLGVGGNIPIDATITLEFLPTVSLHSAVIFLRNRES